ncbi:MAG: threonine-phosphate decarboxylase [Hyphomicrobiaceae bacterium]
MRDHGGNIDEAIARFGGEAARWIDLSTGINRQPYPIPSVSQRAWTDLPTHSARENLSSKAARAYSTTANVLPVAGAQAAIQLIPRLMTAGTARVLAPTYNEHAAALRQIGWQVSEVEEIGGLDGASLAVVVNPNNPDGRRYARHDLLALADKVGLLVVDESFADLSPELSLAPFADRSGLLVLRSFGKFYGLAGLRLGFVIGASDRLSALHEMAGPWSVSGVALEIGQRALDDDAWRSQTTERLQREAERLDRLAYRAGWELVGGTALFRTYVTSNAAKSRDGLASHQIWTRIFPYSESWLRLALPGSDIEWQRLEAALDVKPSD